MDDLFDLDSRRLRLGRSQSMSAELQERQTIVPPSVAVPTALEPDPADAAESERVRHLYHEYFARACAYASKLVGHSDAEDVVQEAFLRITRYRSLPPQDINAPFVLTIVRNTALTVLARRSQELRRRTQHSQGKPHQTAPAAFLEALNDKFLGELTDGQREALILVEVRGLSETQASLALDISRPVVSAKKRSAVQTLRALYMDDRSAVA